MSPGGLDGKASAYSMGDLGSTPGSGISSGKGNVNPLQYSCLENPMDGGVIEFAIELQRATLCHRVAKSNFNLISHKIKILA